MKHPQFEFAVLVILAGLSAPAIADDWQDCKQSDPDKAIAACTQIIGKSPAGDRQLAVAYAYRGIAKSRKGDYDRAIADHTKAIEIDPKYALAYNNRGIAYRVKNEHGKAIADFSKAIEIDPKNVFAYTNRGVAYRNKGEHDKAIADYTKAIEIDTNNAGAYFERGLAHLNKGDNDRAIADNDKAIELNPKNAVAYNNRGFAYRNKGENDKAIADYTKAIQLDPKFALAYTNRGIAYRNKGENDKAIADYTKVIEIDPKNAGAYNNRAWAYFNARKPAEGLPDAMRSLELRPNSAYTLDTRAHIFEALGRNEDAIVDYRKVLELPALSAADRQRLEIARERIAKLSQAAPAAPSVARRVALVIGNSKYVSAGPLTNPANDARAMAAVLRRLGFAEVMEHYDLSLAAMNKALKEFGDHAEGVEWAVVYYAGHGLEMNGTNYLVPTDAELWRDTHVSDETVPLDKVLAKVDGAKKLALVILDACRNNPFLARMVRTGGAGRSIGRGLAPIELDGNVLVAYAAKGGNVANDGSGDHSPFAEAVLANIEEPGLEIQFLFRKVRDRVREKTAKQQDPFLYGTLGSEPLYFKAATAR